MNLWFSPHSNDSTDELVLLIPAVIDEETGPREALQPVQDAELLTDRSGANPGSVALESTLPTTVLCYFS